MRVSRWHRNRLIADRPTHIPAAASRLLFRQQLTNAIDMAGQQRFPVAPDLRRHIPARRLPTLQ
jgi:hypothetical protein